MHTEAPDKSEKSAGKDKKRFKKPADVMTAWEAIRQSGRLAAENRSRINEFAAGDPPYSEAEADEIGLETNVNWQEMAVLLWQARQKFNSAFISRDRYMHIRLQTTEQEIEPSKKHHFQEIISQELNRIIKNSQHYTCVLEEMFCSGALHGLGVSVWFDRFDWCPEFVGLEDVQFPSRTFTNLRNLDYFGIYKRLTYSELKDFADAEENDGDGWNRPMLKMFLEWLLKQEPKGGSMTSATSYLEPEMSAHDRREHSWGYQSDIIQSISFIDWYYKDTDGKWKRRLLPDYSEQGVGANMPPGMKREFLYESNDAGEDHEQIVHLLITDLLNTPPFRVSLIRGLGHMLYAPLMVLNRIRCKVSDAVFTNLLELFRVSAADDQERLGKIDLYNYGVVPEGMTWVPGNERYKPDYNFVNMKIGQINQTISEIAASFRSDPDDGTQREMTAREVMARVNQASAMVGAILNKAFSRMTHQYREIARRFAIKGSPNEDVKKFQNACIKRGVPEELLDYDRWDVVPNRPVGNGIKTLELAQTEQLMAIRPTLAPHAQTKVTRLFVEANTDDPELANELVPMEEAEPSPAVTHASAAMGTLLQGLPYVPPRSINLMEFAMTLVGLLGRKVKSVEENGGMPSPDLMLGLVFAHQFASNVVKALSEDKGINDQVKQLAEALGEIANLLKAFQQRLEEAQQQGQGMDPADMAKIKALLIKAETEAKVNEAKAEQKMRHQEIKFERDQDRKDVNTKFDLQRKGAQTQAEIESQDVSTAAKIRRENAESRTKEDVSDE